MTDELEVESVKRRRGKSEVVVEGLEPQLVPDIVVMRHCIHEGQTYSADEWRSICAEAREELCSDQALRLLSQRPHGEYELSIKLRQRKYDQVAIKATMVRLAASGLLDDEAFARLFAEDKLRFAGWGRRRIEAALRRKGVNQTIARTVVAEICDEEEDEDGNREFVSAMQVAERKLRSLQRETDPWVRRRKLTAFLARRGFGGDVCRQVIKELEASGGEGDASP